MSRQTEIEKRISSELKYLYSDVLTPELEQLADTIRTQTLEREAGKKILIVWMPEDLLPVLKMNPKKMRRVLLSTNIDFHVFCLRDAKIISVSRRKRFYHNIESKNMKANVHEAWIKDLCFPSLVEMRKTDVFRGVDKVESALVSTNSGFDEDEFRAMECVFNTLTGRKINYGHIFY